MFGLQLGKDIGDDEDPDVLIALEGINAIDDYTAGHTSLTAHNEYGSLSEEKIVIKFKKWDEKEHHTKHICGREDKVLT